MGQNLRRKKIVKIMEKDFCYCKTTQDTCLGKEAIAQEKQCEKTIDGLIYCEMMVV